jgi:hypothetical protein
MCLNILFKLEVMKSKNNFLTNNVCVILPYGGGVSLEFDYIVWACNNKNIKCVAIQENWDNLSSKSLLLNHPTHFMTWGKQSSSHLRSIQKFKGEIREIGSLRLNDLYEYRNTRYSELVNFEIDSEKDLNILIVGTGPATHDFKLIEYVSLYLDSHSELGFKIYFRPHPYFKNSEFDLKSISKLKNVSIFSSTKSEKNSDRMNQILECSVIVGLYSTVIFEASILNKPCIIPSFIVPNRGYETYNFLDDLAHYSGISTLNNIFNASTEIEFWSILSKIHETNHTSINNSNTLEWFCKNTNTSKEIYNFIKEIT